ncbi:MAG: hypothetical protein AVDCRST_MAG03-2309 [uncultured Rubrobacteraceae bacterium]|uniref:Uncharacterized protein n=1 Tax=uncultured Rubrobacteraceae bacterium TaxID=349277 RepID=A0A6J4PJE2_9ACTN|nr:MAG: hypothetical protein AVDCRST_MAG03-2309 [uncultured Rubrobacteraceae bacterium]
MGGGATMPRPPSLRSGVSEPPLPEVDEGPFGPDLPVEGSDRADV